MELTSLAPFPFGWFQWWPSTLEWVYTMPTCEYRGCWVEIFHPQTSASSNLGQILIFTMSTVPLQSLTQPYGLSLVFGDWSRRTLVDTPRSDNFPSVFTLFCSGFTAFPPIHTVLILTEPHGMISPPPLPYPTLWDTGQHWSCCSSGYRLSGVCSWSFHLKDFN